ncbi:hypothetical protein SAMN06295900_1241 [Trinickia caryophylli]|uniref:Uncharacterized protein n=1 Tax=Trinickia caryophylli TaxID=28094 RepID=A0A1X7H8L8_TRICW|nr:hypothetical protein SAMN06295900_1241 [Trinickia caryophylli]
MAFGAVRLPNCLFVVCLSIGRYVYASKVGRMPAAEPVWNRQRRRPSSVATWVANAGPQDSEYVASSDARVLALFEEGA